MITQGGVWVAGRAKLNLGLAVTGRRSDGYHLLLTLFHSLELHDWVLVGRDEPGAPRSTAAVPTVSWVCRAGENGIYRVQVQGTGGRAGQDRWSRDVVLGRCLGTDLVPADARNLACRAAAEVAGAAQVTVRQIIKAIPAGAGLGGGSADAAATWQGAVLLSGARSAAALGEEQIRRAARLGADVPFALTGGAALAAGIGEDLVRLPPLDFPVILIKPAFALATAEVFRWYDEDRTQGESRDRRLRDNEVVEGDGGRVRAREAVLALARVLAAGDRQKRRQRFKRYVLTWGRELPNELAPSVYRRCTLLGVWRERLAASSALAFGLTGSGSALFALAEDAAHFERLWAELVRTRPDISPPSAPGKLVPPVLLIATRLWSGPPF